MCRSGVDLHNNISDGFIGGQGFSALMGALGFSCILFLEVQDSDGKGPDLNNINLLKKIRRQVGLSG